MKGKRDTSEERSWESVNTFPDISGLWLGGRGIEEMRTQPNISAAVCTAQGVGDQV
jgi:hypothetical protein